MENEYEELILEWIREIADEVCGDCIDTCCKVQETPTQFDKKELEVFINNGVPIYTTDKLIKRAKYFTLKNVQTHFDISGHPLVKPSLVQVGPKFVMYTDDYCPLYEESEGICRAHDVSLKPLRCQIFPLFNIHQDSNNFFWSINEYCKMFNTKEVRQDFRKRFTKFNNYITLTSGEF